MSERTASRGRVLVVEDEAYVRESLVEILGSRRFDASADSSYRTATEKALIGSSCRANTPSETRFVPGRP